MNLEASRHCSAKSQYKNMFSEALKKTTQKKLCLKASAAVKMRLPPRRELDIDTCNSPQFGTKNGIGLETCPDPKHEKMSAMGHEVGILLQVIRKLLQSELKYPPGTPRGRGGTSR